MMDVISTESQGVKRAPKLACFYHNLV